MLLSAVSVLVVAQSSSEIPEGLMNNPVLSPFQRASLNIGTTKITETSAILLNLFGVIAQKQDQNRHRATAKPRKKYCVKNRYFRRTEGARSPLLSSVRGIVNVCNIAT